MSSSEFRASLKTKTDPYHQKVDAAFAPFDLSEESGLEGFLTAQAAALLPLERALDAGCDGGASALISDWDARRRSPLLSGIGLDVPDLHVTPFESKAAMLGALYVLEGSKLGARFLLRRVARTTGRFAQAAILFLGHDAESDRWASFLRELEHHAAAIDIEGCVMGGIAAFELFERAASITSTRAKRQLRETSTS